MTCPTCTAATQIIDTRPDGHHTVRRRQCRQGHIFQTIEIAVADRAKAKGEQR